MGLSSCRLALHTLPDYVGKQEFELHDVDKPGYAVYRCEDVFYVKLPGYYVRPRVAVFESYDLKDGDWGNVFGDSSSSRPHIKETILYLPLTRELVSMWNETNTQRRLQFMRYQSGVLTEEEMKEKQGKLIAHGSICGWLRTEICSSLTQKSYAHYALRPIAIPLELVDAASTIPLSASAGVTALVVGVPFAFVYDMGRQIKRQVSPKVESANTPSKMEETKSRQE